MPDCPETWYCLEIQVISTEDGGTTPPPLHALQAPVVEDMLWDGKSGLTKVVITGLGCAILFYQRQSLGEGLSLGKVCNVMFMLSGSISWVGKQAQFNANTLSLWEGWWVIVQAITKQCADARGPGGPCTHLPAFLPFRFCDKMNPHQRRGSWVPMNEWRSQGILIMHHIMTKDGYPNEAGIADGCEETYGLPHPCHLHPHQIAGLRMIEALCQLLHWCHPSLIVLEVPGIHTTADCTAGSPQATWKSTCQSSRMRIQRMPSHIKVGTGIWLCIDKLDVETHTSPLHHLLPTGLPWGVGKKFRHRCNFRQCMCHTGWTL